MYSAKKKTRSGEQNTFCIMHTFIGLLQKNKSRITGLEEIKGDGHI